MLYVLQPPPSIRTVEVVTCHSLFVQIEALHGNGFQFRVILQSFHLPLIAQNHTLYILMGLLLAAAIMLAASLGVFGAVSLIK